MSSENRKKAVYVVAAIFVFVFVAGGLVLLEGASYLFLNKYKGWKGSPAFFYDKRMAEANNKTQGLAPGYGALDPHLGYAHGDDFPPKDVDEKLRLKRIPGFVVYGDDTDKEATRIVALGSSTTDPTTFLMDKEHGPDNWPKLLNDICQANGKKCVVYNGGIGGFTSSQEVIKFIRDVVPLKPDVVISLNGGNELYYYSRPYPFTHHYQLKLFNKLVGKHQHHLWGYFPSTLFIANYLLNKGPKFPIYEGTAYEMPPAQIWSINTRTMNAVAKEHGMQYFVFLQPLVGFGNYIKSAKDEEYLKVSEEQDKYLTYLTQTYTEASLTCAKAPFCTDLTSLFDGKKDLFSDPRHPNREGDVMIANAIYQQLINNQAIK